MSADESVSPRPLAIGTIRRSVLDVAGIAALILIRVAIGLALLYAATIIYGVLRGYALPTATVFHLLPHAEFISRMEDNLPIIIITLALLGAGFGWLTHWRGHGSGAARRNQIATLRLLQYAGLPLVFGATLLALSGPWSGLLLDRTFPYSSIGGLVPNSDAGGHFVSAPTQVITGVWTSFGSRRPFAAAFRELTMMAGGLSYVWTLVVQAVLVSLALFAAARSIALWRGVWCALAFSALSLALIQPFITTTLTEPLGLFWGLLSVTFYVECMRASAAPAERNAIGFAFLALVALTVGEMTRMGSLFTIPAFVLWIALAFSSTFSGRLKLFAIGSGVVLLLGGVQALLFNLYGDASAVTGGNFAFTLCGLTVGGDWTSCTRLYAEDYNRLATEREQVAFLFSKGLAIAAHDPRPMLLQMAKNVYNLVRNSPGFVMFGYLRSPAEGRFPWWPMALLIPGIWWALRSRRSWREALFWTLMLASMAASAAIIFADDGWRVFFTTWPYVALLVSLGFASPGTVRIPVRASNAISLRSGTAAVASLIALTVIGPATARLIYNPDLRALAQESANASNASSEQALLLGRTLTGFAVIPDAEPFPLIIPAMHVSDFRAMMVKIEFDRDYGQFLDAAIKTVPFAFVSAARLNDAVNQPQQIYVAPVRFLSEPNAVVWRVKFDRHIALPNIHEISAYERLQ